MYLDYGKPERTRAPEPLLMWPTADPVPAPGCGVCGMLAEERGSAYGARDMSRVTDLNVRIRRHPS
ncbi:hypothetical protein [Streptomyces sp. x-80]|uniref:hypothetical protein n=1 Tax=Streptomyces sp. x-80 TaxID=2789282 RepID=UPI0039803A2D